MSFVKLQKNDIIKIEKGMKINAIIPDPVHWDTFSMNLCIVGKTFNYVTPLHTKTVKFQDALEKLLIDFDIPTSSSKYKEEMENFIKHLGFKHESKTFDTYIYEGKYQIYLVEEIENGDCLVHCKKIDMPLITIKFNPNLDENKNIQILNKEKESK